MYGSNGYCSVTGTSFSYRFFINTIVLSVYFGLLFLLLATDNTFGAFIKSFLPETVSQYVSINVQSLLNVNKVDLIQKFLFTLAFNFLPGILISLWVSKTVSSFLSLFNKKDKRYIKGGFFANLSPYKLFSTFGLDSSKSLKTQVEELKFLLLSSHKLSQLKFFDDLVDGSIKNVFRSEMIELSKSLIALDDNKDVSEVKLLSATLNLCNSWLRVISESVYQDLNEDKENSFFLDLVQVVSAQKKEKARHVQAVGVYKDGEKYNSLEAFNEYVNHLSENTDLIAKVNKKSLQEIAKKF